MLSFALLVVIKCWSSCVVCRWLLLFAVVCCSLCVFACLLFAADYCCPTFAVCCPVLLVVVLLVVRCPMLFAVCMLSLVGVVVCCAV